MRRFVVIASTGVLLAAVGQPMLAQSPSPSGSPSPPPSESAAPAASPTLSIDVYTPAETTGQDAGLPGSLRLTLPQFTTRWNAAPGSTKLHGPWKITKGQQGLSSAQHDWTSTEMSPFGLVGIVDPTKQLISMSLIYVPQSQNGSIEGSLEALEELLLGSALVDAATDVPEDLRIATYDALLTPNLGPQDFLKLDEAVFASGYYLRFGPSDSGDASYLIVRQANVPVGAAISPEPTPVPTSAAPTIPSGTPVPTPVPSGVTTETVTRTGSGSGQSLKFALSAGDYQADWTATVQTDTGSGCYAA